MPLTVLVKLFFFMTDSLKPINRLTEEAIRIGDELVAVAQKTPEGWYWLTQHVGERRADGTFPIDWYVTDDLYSGSTGILFFLAALHDQVPKPAYRQAIEEGARWSWHRYQQREYQHYALITGWLGVAWTLVRIGTTLGDTSYHEQAVQIATESRSFIENPDTTAEYFNGLAGLAVGLLLIHQATKQPTLLSLFNKTTELLIAKSQWGPAGIFYDRNRNQTRGLCGMSHGAAGAAAAFLEAGYYTGNPALYRLAFQVFQYEDSYYSEGQWPDFRRTLESSREQAEAAFQSGDFSFFTDPYAMSAWCHGNVGIALVRARAYSLTQNIDLLPLLRDSVVQHIDRGIELSLYSQNFTLCHGISGSIEMLTAVAPLCPDPDQVMTYRQQAIDKMLAVKPNGGIYVGGYANSVEEDTSLFMGNAGIGYTYLRLAFANVPSLLLPTFNSPGLSLPNPLPIQRMEWAELRLRILNSRYARTLGMLQAAGSWPIRQLTDMWADEQVHLRALVDKAQQELPPDTREILDEAWQLDSRRATIDNTLNPVFELAKWERWIPTFAPLQTLDEMVLAQLTLRQPWLFHVMQIQYDWRGSPTETAPVLPAMLPSPAYAVIWGMIDQVQELRVLTLGGLLLEAFAEPLLVAEAWKKIEAEFDDQPQESQQRILRQRLYEQTLFFVQKGMLLVVNSPT
jgi:Lanthionine synthetase C-like protein